MYPRGDHRHFPLSRYKPKKAKTFKVRLLAENARPDAVNPIKIKLSQGAKSEPWRHATGEQVQGYAQIANVIQSIPHSKPPSF